MSSLAAVAARLDRIIELLQRFERLQAPTNPPNIATAPVAEPPIAAPERSREPLSGTIRLKRR